MAVARGLVISVLLVLICLAAVLAQATHAVASSGTDNDRSDAVHDDGLNLVATPRPVIDSSSAVERPMPDSLRPEIIDALLQTSGRTVVG